MAQKEVGELPVQRSHPLAAQWHSVKWDLLSRKFWKACPALRPGEVWAQLCAQGVLPEGSLLHLYSPELSGGDQATPSQGDAEGCRVRRWPALACPCAEALEGHRGQVWGRS